MPMIHISRNALANINATERHEIAAGSDVLGFVDSREDLQGQMLIAVVNGEPRLRGEWVQSLHDGDVVLLIVRPRGGGGSNSLRVLASLAVLAFAGWAVGAMGLVGLTANLVRAGIVMAGNMLVNQLMPLPTQPDSRALPEPSPTYSLRGQSNMARIGQPIPLHYGRHIVWPDLVMSPYYEYSGDDQWYHVLLCVGLGHVEVTDIKFGDIALLSLDSASYGVQVMYPGQAVSLLPATVYTASVSGVELSDVYSTAGFANPPGSQVTELGVDFAFTGLVKITRNGDMADHTVTVEVQARAVNDVDAALTGWSVVLTKAFTAKSVDPLRETVRIPVTAGRYEVKARVTVKPHTEKDGDGNTYRDTCVWGGLRGYGHTHPDYGDCTLLAVKVKANELLSQQSTQQISCIGTRYLRHWTTANGWSVPQASRSIVWALADAYLSANNGNQPENTVLLTELETLHTRLDTLHHYFDYRFDESGAKLLPTMNLIARAGRSIVVHHIGRWRVIRDELKTVPVQMFTADNMRDFSVSLSAPQDHDPDALLGTFIDADTWQQATLTYSEIAEPLRPETVDLPGVTSRQQAWGELAYMVKAEKRRERGSFVTGMEGRIPIIYDLIAVCPEGVDWGYYGHVAGIDGNTLVLSNPLPFSSGKIMLRNARGGSLGVFAIAVNDGVTATATGLPALTLPDVNREPIYYIAGETESSIVLCKVTDLRPQQDDMVQVGFVVEDAGVYLAPGEPPVDTPSVVGGGGVNLAIPWLNSAGRSKTEGACSLTFAWGAAGSAEVYEADYKINDAVWVQAALSGELSYTLDATPSQMIQFRVRAKSSKGIGAYQSIGVTACGAALAVAPDPGQLALESPFVGSVLKVAWSLTKDVGVYKLRIYDTATMTLRREVTTSASRFDYSYLDARGDGGTFRNMTLRLHTTRNGVVSDVYSQLVVSNPQVAALTGLQVVGFNSQVGVLYTSPTVSDWAGVLVYMSEVKGFTPSAANLMYDGTDPVIGLPIKTGAPYYVRVAAYDFWGRDALNMSAEYAGSALVVDTASITKELDALALALDKVPSVVDSAIKAGVNAQYITGQITKTQVSDGAITTPKIAAGAVTAGEIAAGTITAAEIATGAITAGKIAALAISGDKIAANTITAGKIAALAISGDKIAANTLTADKLFVANLAAISASMGTLTTGKLQNASGRAKVDLDASGSSNVVEFRDGLDSIRFAIAANGKATFTGTLGVIDPDSQYECFATAQHAYSNSYISSALTPSTSVGIAFYAANGHYGAARTQRIRTSTNTGQLVPVIVTATAVVDHHFTLWYKQSTASQWYPFAYTYDPVGGDGSVTLTAVMQLGITKSDVLYISATATDTSGGVYDSSKVHLRQFQMSAMVVNI
jgi:predicted phage tail protein